MKYSCGIILQQRLRFIFVSDDGFIGIAPPGARKGDSICVLLGHPVPFIIRPKGDDSDLIGLARIPGMVNSEIVERLEVNERGSNYESSQVETIRLVYRGHLAFTISDSMSREPASPRMSDICFSVLVRQKNIPRLHRQSNYLPPSAPVPSHVSVGWALFVLVSAYHGSE